MKVVCVKEDWYNREGVKWDCPKEGKIYTVDYTEVVGGVSYYSLAEFDRGLFMTNHFTPLDETFVDEVLHKINEQIEEEYLILK